jgi:protease secretion system membrane fusion protein
MAPLDEGVPGPGLVAIDTKRKVIQHLSGGLVKEVFVREGQEVKEGELLLRLDEAASRANFEAARQRYIGLRAMQDRLQAEQRGHSSISLHPDVVQAARDPQIQLVVATQQQLFGSRRASLGADLQSMQENIAGQEGMILAYENMSANRKNQLALLTEELTNTKGLVAEGYAPRNRQLELERQVSEMGSALAELQGNLTRAKRAIAEVRQRMVARQQEFNKEVESTLADVGREVEADQEKYRAIQGDMGRLEIKAPAAGQVVGLTVQSIGAVIGAGQKLMDIVPKEQALLIEAKVAPHLIDKVRTGIPVDVRFSSFSNTPQLVVKGSVQSVSGDLIVEQNGMAYYLARISITEEGFKALGDRQLQSGMPVEVIFITGKRSVLTYLLHPLMKRMAASMKEE